MLEYIGMNESLQKDIINKEFRELAKMLCSPTERMKIDSATWKLLSDHLKGKPIRKTGPRCSEERHKRNEKAFLQHRQLMQEGFTYDEAIARMAEMECEIQKQGKEPTEYEGRIKSYLQEHKKWQKELDRRKEEEDAFSDYMMEVYSDNLK